VITALEARGATPQEAAAIVAATVRFMHDTAPAPPRRAVREDPWSRAARLEDTGADPGERGAWGDSHPWGRPG
jgi:hypothetical protein